MTVVHGNPVVSWTEPRPVAGLGTVIALPGRGETLASYDDFGRHLAGFGYRVHVVTPPDGNPCRAAVEATELLGRADPARPRALFGSGLGAVYACELAASAVLLGISHVVLAGVPGLASAEPLPVPVLELPGRGSDVTPAIAAFLARTVPAVLP